jgi:hypothetical protein
LLVISRNNNFQNNNNNFKNDNSGNRNNNRAPRQNLFGNNGVTRNGARDADGVEVYPGCDGKVCLPEADLCAIRKEKVRAKECRREKPKGFPFCFSFQVVTDFGR